MTGYKITVAGIKNYAESKILQKALEDLGKEVRVSINVKRGEVFIDSNQDVSDIIEVIEECGYEFVELDLD